MSVQHRWAAGATPDAGVTLIEVVVAMMVFALIAAGVTGGITLVQRMSGDDRSREVATNLAAQDLDAVRTIGDPFQVFAASSTTTVSGIVFTTTRATSWISAAGSDTSCGTSANLLYRRVNVTVTWAGELATTPAVRSDIILAPDGPISDPTTGTIAVYVKGIDGTPRSGVTVTITPVAGGTGTVLTDQPNATDVEGCSYATSLTPGSYTVAITKSGYVDNTQNASPSATVSVTAGATKSQSFYYDAGSTYTVNYATNFTSSTPKLPTNLTSSFTNASATYVDGSAGSTELLWPYAIGYSGIAGALADSSGVTTYCNSANPANWASGTAGGSSLAAGVAPTAVAPGAGGSGTLNVPMGVATIKNSTTTTLYVTAVSTGSSGSSVSGDPACSAAPTYKFGQVLTKSTSTSLALPYGSYVFYVSTSSSSLFSIPLTALITTVSVTSTNDAAKNDEIANGGIVTLDPRTKS